MPRSAAAPCATAGRTAGRAPGTRLTPDSRRGPRETRETHPAAEVRGAEQHQALPSTHSSSGGGCSRCGASGAPGSLRTRCWDSSLITQAAPRLSGTSCSTGSGCPQQSGGLNLGVSATELSPTSTSPCLVRAGTCTPRGEGTSGVTCSPRSADSRGLVSACPQCCVAAPLCSPFLQHHHRL